MSSVYSRVVWFLEDHPKLSCLLLSLFPTQHLWLHTKREWSVGRTFNDGPGEYYWPWKKYWRHVREGAGYEPNC